MYSLPGGIQDWRGTSPSAMFSSVSFELCRAMAREQLALSCMSHTGQCRYLIIYLAEILHEILNIYRVVGLYGKIGFLLSSLTECLSSLKKWENKRKENKSALV